MRYKIESFVGLNPKRAAIFGSGEPNRERAERGLFNIREKGFRVTNWLWSKPNSYDDGTESIIWCIVEDTDPEVNEWGEISL